MKRCFGNKSGLLLAAFAWFAAFGAPEGFVSVAQEPYPETYFDFPVSNSSNAHGRPCDGKGTASERDLPHLEALAFKVEGASIYGQILVPSPAFGKSRPCAIICHGFAGFTRWDDVAHDLCRAGIVVIIPHHRGAWGSEGDYLVTGCIRDAEELAKWASSAAFTSRYGTDANAVYLIGHSMGGNSVVNAAARLDRVRGVALIAPCDIGYMASQKSKEDLMAFLIGEGLKVLKRQSDRAVVDDIYAHAATMRFSVAAPSLAHRKVFLATGEYDTVVSLAPLDEFWTKIGGDNVRHIRRRYRSGHALMGARQQLTEDLLEFILKDGKSAR